MQNKYVGDIGDFGKYGLLRHLTGMTDRATPGDALRLGVVWYLFPDDNSGDGQSINYLSNTPANDRKFRSCDTDLYDDLHKIVMVENDRKIARIEKSGILPESTLYYERVLSYEQDQKRPSREATRKSWLGGALVAMSEADVAFVVPDNGIAMPREGATLVFVDPDNGIAMPKKYADKENRITKVNLYSKKGPKYVFMEDIQQFFEQGQSLVIYHHLAHRPAQEQIKDLAEILQQRLNLSSLPWALWCHRGSPRVYFIVPQKNHRAELEKRLETFLDGLWCKRGHFELVTSPNG